jgi:plastocyanin domain-containing protein
MKVGIETAGGVARLVARGLVALGLVALAGCGGTQGSGPQQVRVEVTDAGFTPARVEVRRGRPVVVTFARRTDQTCGTDVVFASLHRGYDLPLNREVRVELSPADVGDTLKFTCSMEMLHGMLVAK